MQVQVRRCTLEHRRRRQVFYSRRNSGKTPWVGPIGIISQESVGFDFTEWRRRGVPTTHLMYILLLYCEHDYGGGSAAFTCVLCRRCA